jgi:drug/metabolite transporter (DMT)-like permease
MGVFVGLLAAACFGSGDFLGGRASRDASSVVVLFVAQLCAAVGAVVLALTVSGDPIGRDVAFGAVAGLVNATGLGLLYRGLALGRMGIVAPIAAVVGAVIPVAWGLLTGERPGAVVIGGVLIAVFAAALISREEDTGDTSGSASAAALVALAAGVGFGTSFVLFAQTGEDSGLWPVLAARVLAVAGAGVAIAWVARRATIGIGPVPGRLAALAGVCDVGATALLLIAIRNDLAVVVAPVAALGPGFTVLWAWTVLREPISRPQVAGLALALLGLVLIAAG